MIASGLAMILVGAWLTLQAVGGNLAGRIRSWAATTLTGPGAPPPVVPPAVGTVNPRLS